MGRIEASQIFSFTDWVKDHPSDRIPGDRIDAQFINHQHAINQLNARIEKLLRADDKLNNDLLTRESFPREILDAIVSMALDNAERISQDARRVLAAVVERYQETEALVRELRVATARGQDEFARALACTEATLIAQRELKSQLIDAVETIERRVSTPLPAPPLLGPNAGGPYAGDVEGAGATAADYAQVSIEWAEHLPDPIPPNILAINAITGDHWSSRWWANRSANAFGMLSWWYQGAWPGMPPSTPLTPSGQPIPIGGMFFNTTTNTMMVWNGSTWINAQSPQKGVSASLYYLASANQTVFPLSAVDRHGRSFAFSATVPEGVESYVGGERVEPQFDYAVDYPSSTITFVRPIAAGVLVVFDILVPALALAPSGSANTLLVNPITPDGVTTAFTGLTIAATGLPVAAGKSEELCVSVDGVIQAPGTAYSAVGASITFAEAPAANSNLFIVWYGPAVLAGGGGGGVEEAPVDGVGYIRRSASWAPVGGPYLALTGGTVSGGTAFTAGIILATPTNLSMGGGVNGQVLTKTGPLQVGWVDAPSGGGGGIADAPNDGTTYARKSAGWSHLAHTDITDWTANVPAASTTTPVMDGTGAVGSGTTWARADHVHPVDTSRYAASNPSGFQTAAQVTASLAPYAAMSWVSAGFLALSGGVLTGGLVVQGPVDLRVGTLTQAGASLTINSALNENWTLALTASITSIAITGWPAAGSTGKVRLVIVNGGAFTMSGWPAGTIWPGGAAPVITSGSGKRDIVLLMSDDGGTTIYGSVVGQDYH